MVRGRPLFLRLWSADIEAAAIPHEVLGLVDDEAPVGAHAVAREDVALRLGDPALIACGFHLTLPTAGLALGAHVVRVIACGPLGEVVGDALAFEIVAATDGPEPGPRIAVISPMKSGSTFVATVLRRYFGVAGFAFGELAYAAWENNLDDRVLEILGDGPCVLRFHLKADPQNLLALRTNGFVPLVLHRNLADTLVSFDDHLRMRGGANRFGIHVPGYLALPDGERYRFLIGYVLPWFVAFYVGWRGTGVPMLAYESLAHGPRGFFERVFAVLGLPLEMTKLAAALEAPMTEGESNRNVGRVGRSLEAFDGETRALLESVVRHHFEPLEELIDELPWRTAGTPT